MNEGDEGGERRGEKRREDNLQELVFSFLHVGPNSEQQAW